jgi:hypothetical protein
MLGKRRSGRCRASSEAPAGSAARTWRTRYGPVSVIVREALVCCE